MAAEHRPRAVLLSGEGDRKLIEIAQSDTALATVTRSVPDITVQQLRDGAAQVSQPGNGGWHFYGLDRDPRRATAIASSWAIAFSRQVGQQVALAQSGSLEKFITADPTQVEAVIAQRSVSLGAYMLASAMILLDLRWACSSCIRGHESSISRRSSWRQLRVHFGPRRLSRYP